LKIKTLSSKLFEMARRISWSQEDSNALNVQDSTLEGSKTLAERVTGEIFRGIVCKSVSLNFYFRVMIMH